MTCEPCAAKRYVRCNIHTNFLFEDAVMTREDAVNANERLVADGQPYRWVIFSEEAQQEVEGDYAA